MPNKEVIDALVKRKEELISNLDNASLEKQHQIYGAINEIDLFLKTLNYYEETDNDTEPIRLVKPVETDASSIEKFINSIEKLIKRK